MPSHMVHGIIWTNLFEDSFRLRNDRLDLDADVCIELLTRLARVRGFFYLSKRRAWRVVLFSQIVNIPTSIWSVCSRHVACATNQPPMFPWEGHPGDRNGPEAKYKQNSKLKKLLLAKTLPTLNGEIPTISEQTFINEMIDPYFQN